RVTPPAPRSRHGAVPLPRPRGTSFASGVRELHARSASLTVKEANDALQHFDMRILIDAQVVWTDPPLGSYGSGFGNDQRRPSHGSRAEVHQVPVGREAVGARVLAHR